MTNTGTISAAPGFVARSDYRDGTDEARMARENTVGYKKPLLTEIYAELNLSTAFSQAKLLELVGRIAGVAPEVEIASVNTVEVKADEGTVIRKTVPRLRCWSTDRTRLVQFSPELVVVNQVGEYLGWSVFEQHFRQVHESLSSVAAVSIQSLSLHTIDRLVVDKSRFSVGRFLSCGGAYIPSYYADTTEACDISLGRGILVDDGFNRQVAVGVRIEDAKVTVQITAAFQNLLSDQAGLFALLDRLHMESNKTFEALITDETRQLMGGESGAT